VFAVGITHDAGKISNCKIKRICVVGALAAASTEFKAVLDTSASTTGWMC
jgi:hypothetical protein